MQIYDYMDLSIPMDSTEAMLAFAQRKAKDLGFDRLAYCALTRHEWYDANDNPAPAVAHNFPDVWIKHYFKHDYAVKDPVVLHAPERDGPFLWDSLSTECELDSAQQTVMQEAGESGLRDGVGVPLHGSHGDVCLMTFAASGGHPDPAAELQKLHTLAVHFDIGYKKVGRSEDIRRLIAVLTPRELECLKWVALGKTSWVIGRILHISEGTVNFHIGNAIRKLGVSNRISAVIKAIMYGLISP